MNVSFGVFLEVGDQTVGTLDGMVQVVVELRVAHQQAQASIGALHLCYHLVNRDYCCVHIIQCGLQIQLVQVVCQLRYMLPRLIKCAG